MPSTFQTRRANTELILKALIDTLNAGKRCFL